MEAKIETLEEVKKEESGDIIVKDNKGRTLRLVEPELMYQLDIIAELGNKKTSNTRYMSIIETVLWIVAIDGENLKRPETELEINFFIKRVGNSGHLAVLQYFMVENEKRALEFEAREEAAKK